MNKMFRIKNIEEGSAGSTVGYHSFTKGMGKHAGKIYSFYSLNEGNTWWRNDDNEDVLGYFFHISWLEEV